MSLAGHGRSSRGFRVTISQSSQVPMVRRVDSVQVVGRLGESTEGH